MSLALLSLITSISVFAAGGGGSRSLTPHVIKLHSTILIEQREISVVRRLSGRVVVGGSEEPASGATVELCSRDWKDVLASTKTDENGSFSFGKQRTHGLFYIQVSSPGLDSYRLRVRIDKHAAGELKIPLRVAT